MSAAFLKSKNGTITGIMSGNDHGDLRNTLLEWLIDDEAEMIIRAPIEVARKSLFESTDSVLAAMKAGAAA